MTNDPHKHKTADWVFKRRQLQRRNPFDSRRHKSDRQQTQQSGMLRLRIVAMATID